MIDVVERGATPGRQPIERLRAHRRIGLALRQHERLVVERDERDLVLRPKLRQEMPHGHPQIVEGVAHAGADVHGDDDFERGLLVREVRDHLRSAVFSNPKLIPGQAAHEPAAAIGHRRVDLDDANVDAFLEVHFARRGRGDEPLAGHGGRDDANHVGLDERPGIPAALRRVDVDGPAHLPAVGEERHIGDVAAALARQDPRFERQAIAHVGALGRRHDLELQAGRLGGQRRFAPPPARRGARRQERDRDNPDHGRAGTGRSGPIAATAPT